MKNFLLQQYLNVIFKCISRCFVYACLKAAKVNARNDIISKLAESSWGAKALTLRKSALALCYSTAGCCAPVWCQSAHTHLIDCSLNSTMWTISGTVRSTLVPRLSVLCHIAPPASDAKTPPLNSSNEFVSGQTCPSTRICLTIQTSACHVDMQFGHFPDSTWNLSDAWRKN